MKKQKAFSLLQLLIEVLLTLFIAGIVVPSLLRSDLATKEALGARSLHTINIVGITFSYKNQNVGFAILGALVGTMVAFAIHFHATTPKNTTSTRTITLRPARPCDTEELFTGPKPSKSEGKLTLLSRRRKSINKEFPLIVEGFHDSS